MLLLYGSSCVNKFIRSCIPLTFQTFEITRHKYNMNNPTKDIVTLQKQTKEHEQKIKIMFQAMQRMERLLRLTEKKASRAMDENRRVKVEITKIKAVLEKRTTP
jgi:hypothetical protein